MKRLIGATLALACVAAIPQSASAQAALPTLQNRLGAHPQATTPEHPREVGDENSATAAASGTVFTGTIQLSANIRLATPLPSGGSVLCELNASVDDINTTTGTIYNAITEIATAPATVSGSTATCLAKIPHSWNLANASTDTVSLSYTLIMVGSATSTSPVNGFSSRESSGLIPGAASIKVPASGSTTTFTISAIL